VVDLLRWSCPQIVEGLEGQDRTALTGQVWWAGPDPVPVWLDQLSEYWIHRQQLLEALGHPSDLRDDLFRPVLDGLRWAYPHRLAAVSGRAGDTVRISITGGLTLDWLLVRSAEGWVFSDSEDGPVVATVTMTADQAWRLLTNNLPAAEHDGVVTTGEDAIVSVLRCTRAIIGLPN
jgi:hypothetical protein